MVAHDVEKGSLVLFLVDFDIFHVDLDGSCDYKRSFAWCQLSNNRNPFLLNQIFIFV